MKENYFKKEEKEYSLFVQVTSYTHYYDVLTIIYYNQEWKEDKNQFDYNDYKRLNFENNYEVISENEFADAQNKILSQISKNRKQLQEEYHKLWFNYLVEKIRIEEFLVNSNIDLTNYWNVVLFRQQKEIELEVEEKREAIRKAYQHNNPQILSNEDIYNKVASTITNSYLKERAKIQAKIQLKKEK